MDLTMRWRETLLVCGLLAFAWLATSTAAQAPPIALRLESDLFDAEALKARLARVRPVVEQIVGADLGPPVPIVVADSAEYGARAASWALARMPAEDPPQDRTMKWSVAQSHFQADSPQAAVFDGASGIWLIPCRMTTANGDATAGILDILLAHELTHVHQDRQLGMETYAHDMPNKEVRLARRAVLEGHAQWVARRAAASMDVPDAFETLTAGISEIDEAFANYLPGLVQEQINERFVYEEGERFFEAVARRLGYAEALARLREVPPSSLYQILNPGAWIERTAESPAPAAYPPALRLLFDLRDEASEGVLQPLLAHELRGSDANDAAVAGVVRATRTPFAGRAGEIHGVKGILQSVECVSPEAAEVFLRATEQGAVSGEGVWHLGDAFAIERAGLDPWREGERRGLVGHLDIRKALGPPQRSAFVAVQRGARVVSVYLDGARHADLRNLARRVWALCEGAPPSAELDDADAASRVMALLARAADEDAEPLSRTAWERLLKDESADVRVHAVAALGGTNGEAARPLLLGALDDEASVRAVAVHALAAWIEEDDAVTARLEQAVVDPDARVRLAAVKAWTGRDDERTLPSGTLIDLASDADTDVRCEALKSFNWDWPGDDDARKRVLDRCARDPVPRVRWAAWNALLMSWGKVTDRLFDRGLKDADPGIRGLTLSRMGMWSVAHSVAARHEDAIRRALRDPQPLIRFAAVSLVSRIKEERWRYLEDLLPLLETPWVRHDTVRALGHESMPSGVVDVLSELIRRRQCRAKAAEGLAEIGRPARRAVPLLRTLLEVESPITRLEAAKALRDLGEPNDPLIAVVMPLLHHEDFMVRYKAIYALGDVSRPNLTRLRRQRR